MRIWSNSTVLLLIDSIAIAIAQGYPPSIAHALVERYQLELVDYAINEQHRQVLRAFGA